jgi:hypothetical protein
MIEVLVDTLGRVLVVAGVHRQQVPHAHGLQVLTRIRWRIVREKHQDWVVHREQPFLHR